MDTTIWSLSLRRKHPRPKEKVLIDELSELIQEHRAVLIGLIRQEVLSGIPSQASFEVVKQHLAVFSDFPIEQSDYEEAARYFNTCRSKGVQGSHVDFLICAVATRYSISIFTTDKDFINYRKYLDFELYEPRKA